MRVKLSDITKYSKGSQINGEELLETGEFIYLNGGINPSGRWSSSNVSGNTVTISEGGNSSGYVNYVKDPFWCGAHCYYLYDGPRNAKYLYYALKSQQDRLFGIRSGACMPNIKKSDLGKFEFEFDTNEQRQNAVVTVLSKVELAISYRKTELCLLDELIKARFVEMFENNDYPTSTLMDVIKEGAGLSYGIIVPGEDFNGGIPMLRPSDFKNGKLDLSQLYRVDPEIEKKYSRTRLIGDEILVQVIGQPGQVMLSTPNCRGMNVTRNLAVIRPDDKKINRFYLKHYIELEKSQQKLLQSTKQSTLKQLPLNLLKQLDIEVPPMNQQNQFASFVEQVDKSKVAVQKSLDETQLLFDSLMQKYFG